MRIVTRPDFDGVVCAALIKDAVREADTVFWTEPWRIAKGEFEVKEGDIIANLPFVKGCGMWFDHHQSNETDEKFKGMFRIAPSAAGVVYNYFGAGAFSRDFKELIEITDRIDSADLTEDEVRNPEQNPWFLLSMTLGENDPEYWNMISDLLLSSDINTIVSMPEIRERAEKVMKINREYKQLLLGNTEVNGNVSVTDFRSAGISPSGNRFTVFSLYPETDVNLKIRYFRDSNTSVIISIGHSIFRRTCTVSAGELASEYGGGGHRGAGSCCVPAEDADRIISDITERLKNR